jgi:small multidrug resistance family-3 protein
VTGKSIALFVVAAIAEIGGAYLMWQAIKEGRGPLFALAGAVALAGYGAVAALQSEPQFGRVLAAYGGVFIVGSLAWGVVLDGFRPDRYDLTGAFVALVGVAIIMYAPR